MDLLLLQKTYVFGLYHINVWTTTMQCNKLRIVDICVILLAYSLLALITPGTCHFQTSWLSDPNFSQWLRRDPKSDTNAYCRVCSRNINIGTMGKTAIKSHLSGSKHQSNMSQAGTMLGYLSGTSTNNQLKPSSSGTQLKFATKTDSIYIYNATAWWSFKMVDSDYSFSACDNLGFIFKNMFPDCDIAANFQQAQAKSIYISCFGVAPYLRSLISSSLNDRDYVLLFDESLDHDMQKKQLDIYVRYWESGKVASRYFDSVFMGHGRAIDLLSEFDNTHAQSSLNYAHLVQLSMDGPNVNCHYITNCRKNYNLIMTRISSMLAHVVYILCMELSGKAAALAQFGHV